MTCWRGRRAGREQEGELDGSKRGGELKERVLE